MSIIALTGGVANSIEARKAGKEGEWVLSQRSSKIFGGLFFLEIIGAVALTTLGLCREANVIPQLHFISDHTISLLKIAGISDIMVISFFGGTAVCIAAKNHQPKLA